MGLLPVERLSTDEIIAASTYLCGACSCQVKSGNPGHDLLFKTPWHEHLHHGLVVVEKELPPLPSTGDLLPERPADLQPVPTPKRRFSFGGYLVAGLIAFLGLGTLVVFRKKGA